MSNVLSTSDNDASTIHGVKVYEKVGILGPNNTVTGYFERAYYYDYLGRVVQTVEKNHLGGISRISTKYNLAGNILAQHESHQPGSEIATFEWTKPNLTPEMKELSDLKKKIQRIETENDILKKALGIISKSDR